jgi:hypothetical protein
LAAVNDCVAFGWEKEFGDGVVGVDFSDGGELAAYEGGVEDGMDYQREVVGGWQDAKDVKLFELIRSFGERFQALANAIYSEAAWSRSKLIVGGALGIVSRSLLGELKTRSLLDDPAT